MCVAQAKPSSPPKPCFALLAGPSSYKEHGHRVLLIWQHSLDPNCSFLSELADSLAAIGKDAAAGSVTQCKACKVNDQLR